MVPMQATTSAIRRPSHSLRQRLQIHERRRAELHAVRLRRAVAHHENAQLAARRFDRLINLARRRRKTFGKNLEMVDQAFDRGFHLFARRRNDARRFGAERPFGRNFFHRLADDLDALANFRDAHLVSRVAIARGLRLHVEIEFVVTRIRESLADVVGHAAGAQQRAGNAHGDGVLRAQDADALRARHPDAVLGEQVFVFVDVAGQRVDHAPHAIQPVRRRFERQAADAEIAGHHPLAGDVLVNLHDLFALAEAVKEDGHRAEIDGVRAEPDQVRGDARQFGEQHADVLRALGNFDAEQLFGGQAEAEVIRKRREVIDAVGERDALRIGLRFAGFFDAGVQIADDRLGFEHDFAVELQNHAQHAVRGRVLRPHVEDHRLGRAGGRLDCRRRAHGSALSACLAKPLNGIILAERMSFPFVRHQDAAQVGMALEANAEQIETLALVPVGRGPDRRDRVHTGSAPGSRTFSRRRACFSSESRW